MSLSPLLVPKKTISGLRNLPRDIFDSQEGIVCAGGAGTQVVTILLNETFGGIGLDLDIANAAGVAGNATLILDTTKIVTLPPGTRFTLENVIYQKIQIQRAVAANAINVNAYFAGVSRELLEVA